MINGRSKVWVRDEESAWLPGTVCDDGQSVKIEPGSRIVEIKHEEDVLPRNSGKATEVNDLVSLVHLNEAGILHVLRRRFEAGLIYTGVGEDILIAMNPYRELFGVYGQECIEAYDDDENNNMSKQKPHVYVAAKRALARLASENRSQSILISGESGAGKTETTKHAIRYLATVSGRQHLDQGLSTVEEGVVAANPALEGLGNAATLRNTNSSRFGKWISLRFQNLCLTSAEVRTTLLEKVRCVHRARGERGFHIFYELLSSVNTQKMNKNLLQASATTRGAYSLPSITDERNLELRRKALSLVLKTKSERFFMALTGLMHLAAIEFEMNDGEDTADFCVSSKEHVESALCLAWESPNDERALAFMQQHDALTKALLQRTVGSVIVPNSVAAAYRARDACVKLAYAQLFDGLVNKCNTLLRLSPLEVNEKIEELSISVLDIFGFEAYQVETGAENSLEQLLINYANEKLQRHFVEYVFEQERSIYANEGVLDDVIATTQNCSFDTFGIENVATLRVLDGAKHSLLPTLDEECILRSRAAALPRSSSDPQTMQSEDDESATDKTASCALVRRFKTNLSKFDDLAASRFICAPRDERDGCFRLRHFAAEVQYSAEYFTSKNMDAIPRAVADLLPLPAAIEILPSKAASLPIISLSGSKRRASSKRTLEIDTVGLRFQKSLADLSRDIGNTKPTFIRCLKPNDEQKSTNVDRPRLVDQLRYCGVLDAVRVARAGYPVRLPHEAFLRRYATIIPSSEKEEQEDPEIWRAIIRHKSKCRSLSHDEDDAVDNEVPSIETATTLGTELSKAQALALARALVAPDTTSSAGVLVGAHRVFLKRIAYEALEHRLTTQKHLAITKITALFRGSQQAKKYHRVRKVSVFAVTLIRGWLTRIRLAKEQKIKLESSALILTVLARRVLAIRCARKLRAETIARGEENYKRAAIACQSAFRGGPLRAAFAYSALNTDRGARRFAATICRRGATAPISRIELVSRQKKVQKELDAAIAKSEFDKAASQQKWLNALQNNEKRLYTDLSKIRNAFLVEAEIARMQLHQLDSDENRTSYERHAILDSRVQRAEEIRLSLCPSLNTLTNAKLESEQQLQDAMQKRQFQLCAQLEQKLTRLSALIDAYDGGDEYEEIDDEMTISEIVTMRETLDTKLSNLERDLNIALSTRDFEQCTSLQTEVAQIKARLNDLDADPEPRLIDARARRAAAVADKHWIQAALAQIQVRKWERRASLGPIPAKEKKTNVLTTMAKRVLPATEQRFQAAKIKNASPNIIPSIDSNHKVKSRSRSMPPAPLVVKKPAQAHSNQLPVVTSKDDDTFSVASTGIAPSVHTINSTATSKASAQSKIKTVKKLRPDPALLVSSGTSIRQACILMAAKRSDCVLIISDEGSLLSIATDKDVVRGFAEHDDHQWPDITSIDAIATHNPTCVQATDEAMSSISLMVTKRWRHLPVLEDETVVGVLCIQRCLTEAIERAQKKIGKTQWSSLKQLEAVDPTLAKALSPLLTDVRTLRNLLAEETSQQQVVTPETNVFEATRLMASGRRAVAVVRSDRGLEDLGILTPKDVVTRVIAKNLDPRATIVESVETPDADTADADATCLDCLGQMHDGAYLNCPVVDRNTKTVLGVVEVMALVEGISTNEDMAVGTYNDNYETSSVTSMQPRDSTMNKSTVAKLRPDLNVLKFTPGTMLNQVCAEMTSKRTDVALVVEDSRNFCGLVTDHDIAFKVVAENLDLQKTSVDAIMSPAPACVSSTDGAVDALKQMVKHKIRHLPVLVDGTVAGVLHVRKCLNDAIEKIEVLERKKKKTESSDNDDLASIISTALGTKNKDMNALLGPLMASLSGQQAKTVASLLSSDKESCIVAASTSVLEAAQRMRATRKAVISTNDQGRIIGILTPRDVLMRCVANNMDVVITKVADIHTAHPETALSTTTLLEAMQKMHDGGFLHLPVVDDTTIIGVVDVINIAYATMGDDHAEEGWSTLMLLDNDQSSVVDDCGSIIARPVPAAQSCGKTVDQLRPDHKPVTALTDEMIIDVCQKMVKRRSDCCLILGSGSESVILGLVTDSDVTRRALAKRVNIETTAICEIMTANPTCVEATSSALDALQLMINSRFRHLPVTTTQGTGPAVLHINRCLYAAITLLEQLADRAKKQAHADKQRIAETVLEVVKSGKTVGSAAVIAPLLESLTSDKAATVSTLLEAEDRSNCILESTASVRTATQVMTQTRQAIAAVDCEGRLVGILSPNDILVRVAAVGKDPDETSIAEVMTTNPQRTTPTATLFSVLEQMHDGRFLTCPVVDGNSVRAVIDVIEVAYATIGGGNNLDEQQAWSALMLSTGDDGSETASVRSAEIAAENIEKTVADLRPERRPVVVSCSTSIAELCSLMLKRRTDCALVTNDASLSGIVTDTDIARKVVAERLHPHLTVVECIMTPKPACVLGTDSALDSLKLMVSNRFRHLPVLDRVNGKIVGILNIHRCLYAAIEKLEKLESALKEKNNNKEQDQQAALAAVLQVAVNASSHRSKGVDPNQLAKMLGPLLDSLDGQKRVGDAIVKNSVTAVVSALAPVRRAAEIMATTRCAVLAIDEETGAVVGILSPKDIAHRVVARDLDPDSTSVEEVFTPDPDTINADASLLEALQMMSDRHYGHLPVVDAQGEVAGVVDVMGMLHATMQGSDGWSTLMATSVGDDQDDDTASQLSFVTPSRQRHRGLRGREDDRLSTTSFDHRGLDNLESQYTYKIIDKRTGHLHRVQASDENFTQVTQSVVKRLQVSAVHLTYQDEDGDDVVLTDDHSLVDAVAYARSSGRPLKLNATIPSKSSEDLNATATSFSVSPIMEKSANSSRRPPPPPANNNAILYISIAALLAIVCVASLSSSSRAH